MNENDVGERREQNAAHPAQELYLLRFSGVMPPP